MLRKLRSRLSYANVVATLALVLAACGGTAFAASRITRSDIPRHAVSASKISPNAISTAKVRNNSLTTADVRNGTLRGVDFAAGEAPKGEKGDKGDPATSIFGTVSAAGALQNGEGVTAVAAGDTGVYSLTFTQDVSRCAVVATVATTGADDGGTVTAAPTGGAQQVRFRTRDLAGAPAQRPFSFAVLC